MEAAVVRAIYIVDGYERTRHPIGTYIHHHAQGDYSNEDYGFDCTPGFDLGEIQPVIMDLDLRPRRARARVRHPGPGGMLR